MVSPHSIQHGAPNYKFTEIFDIPQLTELCESFTRINGTVTALLDLEGHVHIKTGWQKICTQFHRTNPATSARCTESDTVLAGQLASGEKYNVYRCQNGLIDIAVPVMIDGEHVGNFFTGQFLFGKPDRAFFARQAKEAGIDEIPYLEALDEVPIFDEAQVKRSMEFLVNLTQTIGQMDKQRIDLLRHEAEQRNMLEQLVAQRTRELNALNKRLENLAQQDPLTGLANRRAFEQQLKEEFSRARRYKQPLTVVMLDADHFKKINDAHGHPAGDQVLIGIANTLKSSVRQCDVAARLGGEEFCLLLPESTASDARPLLERIRKNIAATPFHSSLGSFHVTCSFGVAAVDDALCSAEELLSHADTALYCAKEQGRNRVMDYAVH